MKVENMKVKDLIPYEGNAKKHDETQIKNVMESIRQFGFSQPIVVDKDNVIIIGHCRLIASERLHMTEVPVVRMENLTEEEAQKLRLLDNKLNESEWDFDLLADQIPELDFDGFDIDWGIPEIVEEEPEVIEDDVPEDVETRCKLGDIWQLGDHRLICGDSTDVAVIDRLMDGMKPDLVYTDPPYGMNAVSKSGVLSEHYKTDILNDDDNTVAIDAFNMASKYFDGARQIWWGANYYTECLPSAECWIVWDKNNGASDQTDCELAWTNFRSVVRQFTMASEKTNRVHPTQKPCRLFGEIIHKFDKDNSMKNVVDIFGGSGSTLIACEQLKRTCFVCELDPYYCDVIIQRWENLTGKQAVRIEEGDGYVLSEKIDLTDAIKESVAKRKKHGEDDEA